MIRNCMCLKKTARNSLNGEPNKEQQLYDFMYTFYKQGNSLEKMFQWLKESYRGDAPVLMSGFMKKYSNDKELKEEFNRSCFI